MVGLAFMVQGRVNIPVSANLKLLSCLLSTTNVMLVSFQHPNVMFTITDVAAAPQGQVFYD